jgi:hypothetical protein
MIESVENSFLEYISTDEYMEIYTKHVTSEFHDIAENVLWLVNNLCSESISFRDKIICSPFYDKVWDLVNNNTNSDTLIKQAIWFFSVIMKLKDSLPPEKIILNSIVVCSNYLYVHDAEVSCHCLWGIYYVSEFDEKIPSLKINNKILHSGVVLKLLKINYTSNMLCLTPSLRILGNLLCGDYKLVDVSHIIFYQF